MAAGLAVVTAVVATGAGAWQSYQPSKLESFTTTGLLGTLRRNAGLLSDVETRAQQATPYVRNLLALSQALQEKFVPGEINQPTAARILLVSDVHGANQYPVMKRIIADEQIDAVIDAGDLLNFGSVAEAEAAGLFTSIEGLGVPYLFVRGNHDASSPTDRALLQRMGRLRNVVLLEPGGGSYTQATVNGVTVAGFNDPRWFGDDDRNNAAKQTPAAEAFNRAYAGRAVPDVVVSHEPGAVRKVDAAGILVNGHLHTDQLEGNRIGVGTFTGGGTVSHFVQDAETKDGTGDPGELAGQPYAFDIAVFGQSCTLTSLTRYTYRNLIQGRPAYDDVQVINGSTIQPAAPGSTRSCAEGTGLAVTPVAEPPATARRRPDALTAGDPGGDRTRGRAQRTTATVAAERLHPTAAEGIARVGQRERRRPGLQPRQAPRAVHRLAPAAEHAGGPAGADLRRRRLDRREPAAPGPAGRRARARARDRTRRPRAGPASPATPGCRSPPASTCSSSTRTTGSGTRRWSGCTPTPSPTTPTSCWARWSGSAAGACRSSCTGPTCPTRPSPRPR